MIELSVVTPESEALKLSAREVAIPGTEGELGILPGHLALITALNPGVMKVVDEAGKTRFYAISTGYAEISNDQLVVLTGLCEAGAELSAAHFETELSETNQQLANLSEDDVKFESLQLRRRVLEARILAKKLDTAQT